MPPGRACGSIWYLTFSGSSTGAAVGVGASPTSEPISGLVRIL